MQIKEIILMIGPPGSGKGTQGRLLAQKIGYGYVSMGQTLREYAKKDTNLAKMIKTAIDTGKIIPDDWIKQIFLESVLSFHHEQGLVLDGFPRDPDQIYLLEDFTQTYDIGKIRGVFLDVPYEQLRERIGGRKTAETRIDDHPEIIDTRFEEYENKTKEVKRHYDDLGILVHVNGDQPIEKVHQDILAKMKIS
jgi:adenylate kinase